MEVKQLFGKAYMAVGLSTGLRRSPISGVETVHIVEVGGFGYSSETPAPPLPPTTEFVPLNRETRRGLGVPGGEKGVCIAADSMQFHDLQASIAGLNTALAHRNRSMRID